MKNRHEDDWLEEERKTKKFFKRGTGGYPVGPVDDTATYDMPGDSTSGSESGDSGMISEFIEEEICKAL